MIRGVLVSLNAETFDRGEIRAHPFEISGPAFGLVEIAVRIVEVLLDKYTIDMLNECIDAHMPVIHIEIHKAWFARTFKWGYRCQLSPTSAAMGVNWIRHQIPKSLLPTEYSKESESTSLETEMC